MTTTTTTTESNPTVPTTTTVLPQKCLRSTYNRVVSYVNLGISPHMHNTLNHSDTDSALENNLQNINIPKYSNIQYSIFNQWYPPPPPPPPLRATHIMIINQRLHHWWFCSINSYCTSFLLLLFVLFVLSRHPWSSVGPPSVPPSVHPSLHISISLYLPCIHSSLFWCVLVGSWGVGMLMNTRSDLTRISFFFFFWSIHTYNDMYHVLR